MDNGRSGSKKPALFQQVKFFNRLRVCPLAFGDMDQHEIQFFRGNLSPHQIGGRITQITADTENILDSFMSVPWVKAGVNLQLPHRDSG